MAESVEVHPSTEADGVFLREVPGDGMVAAPADVDQRRLSARTASALPRANLRNFTLKKANASGRWA
jgi:hypothetical protein